VSGCTSLGGFLSSTPSCEEWILDAPPKLHTSPVAGFHLEVVPSTPEMGREFEVRLRNDSGRRRATAQRVAFDVQYRGEDDWQSIYHVGSPSSRADYGLALAPGEAHRWTFSTSSLRHPRDGIATCIEPSPGEYRFLYWGIPIDDDSQDWGETAIVAPFEIVPGQ
jgi:hypothetical protein